MTEFKPSLWAALDIVGKIMGTVALVLMPILVPAAIRGEPAAAASVFGFIEGVTLYPALLAAFWPAVTLAFTRYKVDDDGIGIRTQFIQKTEQRVPWEKITAVRHRRTMLDVLVGLERIDVIAYGERGATLHLVGLRNAAPLRDIVSKRMRDSATVDALMRGD